MYLLFVDESGTHGGSNAFALGAIAIHESETVWWQRALDRLVQRVAGAGSEHFELHASEIRNARKPKTSTAPPSPWSNIDRSSRLNMLGDAYDLIGKRHERRYPHHVFGVVVDTSFRTSWSPLERERHAYEVLLHKFDLMLKDARRGEDETRGLVIHDRRVVAEQDIQSWVSSWRAAAGRIGKLHNLADVPLFTDSRASRLVQAADLVSYALYRRYDRLPNPIYLNKIYNRFHSSGEQMHGCVHFTPSFGQGSCPCEPCTGRLLAEAERTRVHHRSKRTSPPATPSSLNRP